MKSSDRGESIKAAVMACPRGQRPEAELLGVGYRVTLGADRRLHVLVVEGSQPGEIVMGGKSAERAVAVLLAKWADESWVRVWGRRQDAEAAEREVKRLLVGCANPAQWAGWIRVDDVQRGSALAADAFRCS